MFKAMNKLMTWLNEVMDDVGIKTGKITVVKMIK